MTIKELSKLSKAQLIDRHIANGGLMGRAEYARWTKDELLSAVIEDYEKMSGV